MLSALLRAHVPWKKFFPALSVPFFLEKMGHLVQKMELLVHLVPWKRFFEEHLVHDVVWYVA